MKYRVPVSVASALPGAMDGIDGMLVGTLTLGRLGTELSPLLAVGKPVSDTLVVGVGDPLPLADFLSSPPVSRSAAVMPPAMTTTAMTAAMIAFLLLFFGGPP